MATTILKSKHQSTKTNYKLPSSYHRSYPIISDNEFIITNQLILRNYTIKSTPPSQQKENIISHFIVIWAANAWGHRNG